MNMRHLARPAIRLAIVPVLAAVLLAGCVALPPATRPAPPAEPSTAPPPPDIEPVPEPEPDGRQPRSEPSPQTATLALLRQSEHAAGNGDLESAIAYVERAIRLTPRDAALWLRLGGLQLEAGKPASAEQLARRAIALAGDRADHLRRGWLLLADTQEAQGRNEEAAAIRARWRTYRG